MTTKMQHRRGTASQWSSANPVLAAGELGVVTDTARVKCGNGSSAWNDLPFLTLDDGEVTTAKIADGAVTPAKLATSGRFTFPTGAANGYGFTSGASHLSGTGSPEGVVTAAPGSRWLQTNATTNVEGWIRWVKATGTGNTGWQAGPEADTGWRNITQMFKDAIAAHANAAWFDLTGLYFILYLRRVGSIVSVKCYDAFATNTAGVTDIPAGIWNVPQGFWVRSGTVHIPVFGRNSTAVAAMIKWNTDASTLRIVSTMNNPNNGFDATWVTTGPWPTSLPGSAG